MTWSCESRGEVFEIISYIYGLIIGVFLLSSLKFSNCTIEQAKLNNLWWRSFMNLQVSSAVPEGKGVSSSASVEVASMSAIAASHGSYSFHLIL